MLMIFLGLEIIDIKNLLRTRSLRKTRQHAWMRMLFAVVLNALVANIVAGDSSDWTRGFIGTPRDADTALIRCEMITVTSSNGHLRGQLLFINETDSGVDLKGGKTTDGKFWPSFTAQVLNEGEKEWKTIGKSNNTEPAVELTIGGYSDQDVHIDMDVFRPSIGKVAYGRVVFGNGIWTMFDLQLFAH